MSKPAVIVLLASVLVLVAGCDDKADDAGASAEACMPTEALGNQEAGSIALVGERRAGSELVVMDVQTRKVRRLTRQRSAHDRVGLLAWSPDGDMIAYSGGTGGWEDKAYDDIWVVPATGGVPRRLTDSFEDDWDPSWSPDGRRIAFDRQDDGYNWIYVVNADGTGLRRLTRNFNWHPVWTPDRRISYINTRGIWVMNADGTDKRLLARAHVEIGGAQGMTPMVWSPHGKAIAFTTETALWVMGADGTSRRRIFGDPNRQTRSPTWSPDGRRIAWQQGDGDLEIYVANRDGTGLRNLTDNEKVEDEDPSWSTSGRTIMSHRRCPGARKEQYAIIAINVDGGAATNLNLRPGLSASTPVWSP